MPTHKTLTELLKEYGIPDAPADDEVYKKTKFVLRLQVPRKPVTKIKPGPLIDRNSKEPQDRQKWIRWLAALSVAFRAPQAVLLPRVREVLWSAWKDGVDYRDLYQVAQEIQPSRYPKAPDLELVDPER
jgi:hypothetical protein